MASEVAVLAVVCGKVRDDGQRVGIGLPAGLQLDEALCLLDRGPPVASVDQRPGDVGRDAEDVRVVAVGCAFVDCGGVWFPAAVRLLLTGEPVAGALDEPGVGLRNLRHVAELHEAVGGENLIGGSRP